MSRFRGFVLLAITAIALLVVALAAGAPYATP